MIARGAALGPDTPVILHMLDIEPAKQVCVGGGASMGSSGRAPWGCGALGLAPHAGRLGSADRRRPLPVAELNH